MMRSWLIQIVHRFSIGNKKFIFLFGAPGVGKGTYAKMLKQDFGFNHLSAGDQIRSLIKNPPRSEFDTELIREIVKSGGLVNNKIVISIINAKIHRPQFQKGIILDGFPRTQYQLDKYLQVFPLHGVLNITLRQDILIEKLLGRRTCLKCNIGYNICSIHKDGYQIEPIPSKVEGICDICSEKLAIREDDNQKIIRAKLKQYHLKTEPLLKHFQKMKLLISIQPTHGVKDYYKIKDLLQTKLS